MKTIKFFTIAILGLILTSCSGYGKKLNFSKTEVYYTNGISKLEAQNLGKYLVSSGFADDKDKSVQLSKNKTDGNYVFRMVTVKEAINNKMYEAIFKLMAKQISDSVFNGKPVDFDICDNTFKTLKKFKFKK